jgi:predicted DNA-binding protein
MAKQVSMRQSYNYESITFRLLRTEKQSLKKLCEQTGKCFSEICREGLELLKENLKAV